MLDVEAKVADPKSGSTNTDSEDKVVFCNDDVVESPWLEVYSVEEASSEGVGVEESTSVSTVEAVEELV